MLENIIPLLIILSIISITISVMINFKKINPNFSLSNLKIVKIIRGKIQPLLNIIKSILISKVFKIIYILGCLAIAVISVKAIITGFRETFLLQNYVPKEEVIEPQESTKEQTKEEKKENIPTTEETPQTIIQEQKDNTFSNNNYQNYYNQNNNSSSNNNSNNSNNSSSDNTIKVEKKVIDATKNYYCEYSEFTLKGDMCYLEYEAEPLFYCPDGYREFGLGECRTTSSTSISPSCSCPQGRLFGDRCVDNNYNEVARPNCYCNDYRYYYDGLSCKMEDEYRYIEAIPNGYYCSISGKNSNSSICVETISAIVKEYTCPNGYTLNDTKCIEN